jgi:hypothetical protein
MKKWLFLILAISITTALFWGFSHTTAENKSSTENFYADLKPQSIQAVAFGVSPKVSSFADPHKKNKPTADSEVRFVSENQISRPSGEISFTILKIILRQF